MRLCAWLVGPYLENEAFRSHLPSPGGELSLALTRSVFCSRGLLQPAEAKPGPSAPEAQVEQQSRPRHTHEAWGHDEAVSPDGSRSENGHGDVRRNPETARGLKGAEGVKEGIESCQI